MQKMRRVLYVVPAPDEAAERYLLDIATGSTARHEVLVALPTESLQQRFHQADLRTVVFRDQNLKEVASDFRPDIVHTVGPAHLSASLARQAHQQNKLIISILNTQSLAGSGMIDRFRQGALLRQADCLITTSEIDAKRVSSLPLSRHTRIETISLGITPQPVEHQRSARRLLLEHTPLSGIVNLWSNDTLWLGSIAHGGERGLESTLAALGKLREEFAARNASFIYLLIGEYNDADKRAIKDQVRSHRLETNVFLLKKMTNAAELLTAFDIYIALAPALSYPLLEAGVAARPIIVVDSDSHQEIGTQEPQEEEVLLSVHSETNLTQAIVELAYSPERRNRLGQTFEHLVEEEFRSDTMVEETLRVYRKLTSH